jgi:ABC-type bacteriocin/lantibiotic exporter with double-glycine peptidase domain
LQPQAAFQRLAALRRAGGGPRLASLDPGAGAEELAAALRWAGLPARLVEARADDLPHLDCPTLVQARGGGWFVLLAAAKGHLRLEGAEGPVPPGGHGLLSGAALDLSPLLPAARTFWGRIGRQLLGHRKALLFLVRASLFSQALALAVPAATLLVLDRALPDAAQSLLALTAGGIAAITLFQAWTGWLRQRALLHLETALEASAQRTLVEHILHLPYPVLAQASRADLLQAFYGLESARTLMTSTSLGAVLDGLFVIVYPACMVLLFPAGAALVVLATLVEAAITLVIGRFLLRIQHQEIEASARQRDLLVETIQGVATLKGAGAERQGLDRWLAWLDRQLDLGLTLERLGLWQDVGLGLLHQGINLAVLVWGGFRVLDGILSVGQLLAFVQMSVGFLEAVQSLAQAYLSLLQIRPSLAKGIAFMEMSCPPAPAPGGPCQGDGTLELEDVWFRYGPERPWVVKGFTLRLAPGEQRWLRAPSGGGKTTLLRMAAGLLEPERGRVSLDGRKPAAARDQVIYLPQFVDLYGGSLKENLRILSGQTDWERILSAARESGLDEWVLTLPMGYDSIVPSGGGNMSGGQRQLVALTAMMATRRRILLLDEAMANLDGLRQRRILESPWLQGKTILYASHGSGFHGEVSEIPQAPPLPFSGNPPHREARCARPPAPGESPPPAVHP